MKLQHPISNKCATITLACVCVRDAAFFQDTIVKIYISALIQGVSFLSYEKGIEKLHLSSFNYLFCPTNDIIIANDYCG